MLLLYFLIQIFINLSKMYGRINQRKIHQNDYVMSCDAARQELTAYINQQSKRTNIDSAKKRAVVQHMDYEGFRQMVLGAHIFPTKSKELYNFSKGENGFLEIKAQNNSEQKAEKREQAETQDKIIQKVQGKSQMHCNSFRQFKKKFNEKYSKQFDHLKTEYCYNLIKEQNEDRLRKIFNTECQGNILIKISVIFSQVLTEMSENKTEKIEEEASFIIVFWKTLLSIPTMKSITMAILSKNEKQMIVNSILKINQILGESQQAEKIQGIVNLISK